MCFCISSRVHMSEVTHVRPSIWECSDGCSGGGLRGMRGEETDRHKEAGKDRPGK